MEIVNNQGFFMPDRDLRLAGLKVTLPRIKILKILEEYSTHHLSAEDVYKHLIRQGEDVGLGTIYRVLTQFENAGLVKRHNFVGGHSVFELEHGEHHDHLVCEVCHIVIEFVDEVIEQHQKSIAKQNGFKMKDHSLTIYGICKNCQKEE